VTGTLGAAIKGVKTYALASYLIWANFWRLASGGRLYGHRTKTIPEGSAFEHSMPSIAKSPGKVVPEADPPAAAEVPAEGDDAGVNTTVSDIALDMEPKPRAGSVVVVDALALQKERGHPTFTGVYYECLNPSLEVSPAEDFLHKLETVLFAMGGIDRVVVLVTFFLMCFLIAYFNTFVNMLLFLGFMLAAGFSLAVALIWYKGKGIDVEALSASRRKMQLDKSEVKHGWVLDNPHNPKIATKSKFYPADGETYSVPHTAGQAMLTWEQMGIQDHSYRIMDVVKYRVALETMEVIDEQEAIKAKDDAEAARLKAIADAAAAEQKAIDDAAAAEAAAAEAATAKAAKQKEADDAAAAPAVDSIQPMPTIETSINKAPLVLADTAGSPMPAPAPAPAETPAAASAE